MKKKKNFITFEKHNKEVKTAQDRLRYFVSENVSTFQRKDYMQIHSSISTATASRDLKVGVRNGLFKKEGDKRLTTYVVDNSIKIQEFSNTVSQ